MTSGRDIAPVCPVCTELLGSYGGPVTLPCGHNGCMQCMASVQRRKPECPLCRAAFPVAGPLTVNVELRDLIALAATLHTVEEPDGWQTLAAVKAKPRKGEEGYDPDAPPDASDIAGGAVALVPSAPPLHCDLEAVLTGAGDVLSLEPPVWVPDSHSGECTACRQPFRPFARGRHHCRLCGRIFCGACCAARLLLPPKFRAAEPARACSTCAALLEPLQPFLAGTISRAVQPAVRDVTDASCGHSWLNPPLGTGGLEGDIYKAANIATAFRRLGTLQAERRIPGAVLRGAAGFAILSMAKVGLGWSCGAGTGLVVARREEDDSWSPPSALAALSAGWGLQVGGELTDLLVVLRSKAAVNAFCGTIAAGVGGAAAFAAGPVGRQADAGITMGRGGAALCYSYSISRGAFAGVAVQSTVISSRDSANLAFYGRQHTAQVLLTGNAVPPPPAASALYQALDDLLAWAEALPTAPGFLTNRSIKARDAAAAAQQQLTGCPQDGGLCGSGARRSSRRSRRHGRRSSKEAVLEADSDAEGGWEAPAAAEPTAPFVDGDGWDTGSQLPGGSVHLGLAHEGDGLAALAAEGLSSDRFLLPRPPTRPEVSPPITSRYFGTGPIQIEGGHVAMDGGPPTPPQLHEDEEDAAFGGLFAE